MSAPHAGSHFRRLVDVPLPSGGTLAVMYEGYFDESGDFDEDPRIFCVSGYYITSNEAKIMDEKWDQVLREHNIPYFHMVDCAHGCGVFVHKSKEERINIEKRFIDLIKTHTLVGFSVLAKEEYFEVSDKYPDSYSSSVSLRITALRSFLEVNRLEGKIDYFFETGHKTRGRAYNHVAENIRRSSSSLTFAQKQQVRLLQAADLLAWQTAKYAKDRFYQKRPMRKDFMSLLEHRHTLAYISIKDGESQIAFEEWPLSERSPETVALTLSKDGPITFFVHDDNPMPIVPVDSSLGWRLGGGRMTYVGFRDVDQKEFALAFDELRLRETLMMLVGAAELYGDLDSNILFPTSDINIERHGEKALLRIELTNGGKMTYGLSKDILSKLVKSLEEEGRAS